MQVTPSIQTEIESVERQIKEKASELMELQKTIRIAQAPIGQHSQELESESSAFQARKLTYDQSVETSKKACQDALQEYDELLAEKERDVDQADLLASTSVSKEYFYRLKVIIFRASAIFKWHDHNINYHSSDGVELANIPEPAHRSPHYDRLYQDQQLQVTHFGNVHCSNMANRAIYILGWSRSDKKGEHLPFPTSHPAVHGWEYNNKKYWHPPT